MIPASQASSSSSSNIYSFSQNTTELVTNTEDNPEPLQPSLENDEEGVPESRADRYRAREISTRERAESAERRLRNFQLTASKGGLIDVNTEVIEETASAIASTEEAASIAGAEIGGGENAENSQELWGIINAQAQEIEAQQREIAALKGASDAQRPYLETTNNLGVPASFSLEHLNSYFNKLSDQNPVKQLTLQLFTGLRLCQKAGFFFVMSSGSIERIYSQIETLGGNATDGRLGNWSWNSHLKEIEACFKKIKPGSDISEINNKIYSSISSQIYTNKQGNIVIQRTLRDEIRRLIQNNPAYRSENYNLDKYLSLNSSEDEYSLPDKLIRGAFSVLFALSSGADSISQSKVHQAIWTGKSIWPSKNSSGNNPSPKEIAQAQAKQAQDIKNMRERQLAEEEVLLEKLKELYQTYHDLLKKSDTQPRKAARFSIGKQQREASRLGKMTALRPENQKGKVSSSANTQVSEYGEGETASSSASLLSQATAPDSPKKPMNPQEFEEMFQFGKEKVTPISSQTIFTRALTNQGGNSSSSANAQTSEYGEGEAIAARNSPIRFGKMTDRELANYKTTISSSINVKAAEDGEGEAASSGTSHSSLPGQTPAAASLGTGTVEDTLEELERFRTDLFREYGKIA